MDPAATKLIWGWGGRRRPDLSRGVFRRGSSVRRRMEPVGASERTTR